MISGILLGLYFAIGLLLAFGTLSVTEGEDSRVSTFILLAIGWLPVLCIGFLGLVLWGILGD